VLSEPGSSYGSAGRGSLITGIVGAAVGFFLPRIYVKREQGKRLIRFDDQLSDMLNLMVNGLRAGYSTMQAMEAVSKELLLRYAMNSGVWCRNAAGSSHGEGTG